MREKRCSGWFRALFVAAMLLICALLAFFAVDQVRLRAEIADLTISLDTSRGREARQKHEYDAVVAALPAARAELERVQPLADAAKAEENELRQQRKDIRAENAALQAQIEAEQAELDALILQATALQDVAGSLAIILGTPAPQ